MRGFLGGVSLGALVAVAGAALLSVSVPLPGPVEVGEGAGAPAEQPEQETSLALTPAGQDADLAEALPTVPSGDSSSNGLSLSGTADTAPAGRPQAAADPAALPGPDDAGDAPQPPQPADAPPQPPAGAQAPAEPGNDAAPVVSAEPAAPLPAAPEQDPQAGTDGGTEAPEDQPDTAAAPAAPVPDVGIVVPEITAPDPVQPEDGSVVAAVPGSTPEPGRLPQVDSPPVRRPVPGEAADTDDAAQPGGAEDPAAPRIGTPVVPFTERGGEDSVLTGDPAPQSVSPALLTPFEAFSEPFENPENRPLMSIVLIDDAQSIGAEALAGFPYPLSFAIDPEDPGAAAKMAERRASGFEVLVLADLPREAAPQDAETALPVWLDRLPEAIGVLEGTGTGVQGSRALADQVSALAAAGGLGLVMQNSGLNTVQKLAARDGVPSGVVFRDFDGAGQNPRAIRRFLDQAAFRAGQEGAVIMLGRVRPDTISALLLWGLQDRAGKVALAPVSASLKAVLPDG